MGFVIGRIDCDFKEKLWWPQLLCYREDQLWLYGEAVVMAEADILQGGSSMTLRKSSCDGPSCFVIERIN